ncbi:MAG: MarR family transcriptional regulator [Pseudomonadota bacterium]
MTKHTLDSLPCFALYSASKQLTGIYRSLLSQWDITYPQFLVLMALWEEDKVSISELSERTTLGNSTLTPLIRLLEKKQLVKRRASKSDERQTTISLTPRGKRLSNASERVIDDVLGKSGLTKRDARELVRICGKVRDGAASSAV